MLLRDILKIFYIQKFMSMSQTSHACRWVNMRSDSISDRKSGGQADVATSSGWWQPTTTKLRQETPDVFPQLSLASLFGTCLVLRKVYNSA